MPLLSSYSSTTRRGIRTGYEIDLSARHASELRSMLSRYISPERPCVMDGIGDGKAPAPRARLLTPLHLRRWAGVLDAGDLVERAARARELLTRS